MKFFNKIAKLLLTISFLSIVTISSAQEVAPANGDGKKLEKSLIDSGKFYFASKNYEAAIQQWSMALSMDPQNKEVEKYISDAKAKLEEKPEPSKDIPVTAQIQPKEVKEIVNILSMKDCINIAVKNHIPLQVASKSVKLAEMRVFEARRNMLPSATIAFEESSGKIQGRRYVGRKQYLEGQQPVFHGGELYFTMKQAETNLEVTRNDYERIKNELVLQVKKGYYTLGKARENLEMQKWLSQEVNRVWSMVSKQYDSGLTSKLELLNVSSQSSQVKYQLASADGDVSVAELILKQAMNVEPKERIDVKPDLEFKKIAVDFERALSAAYMNRPEVKINSLMIEYYNYGKKIARAKGWPKIDILGQWGLAKEEFVSEDRLGPTTPPNTFDNDEKLNQQWYAGIKGSMPFWGSTGEYSWTEENWVPVVSAFHGTEAVTSSYKLKVLDKLDYYSDNQLADVDYDRARQELCKAKMDITLEVKESCFNYEKALLQLDTATNKVKFQEKDLEVNRFKRQLDELPDSNIIESMIKLSQEKFGYLQAESDCYIAVASLNKAIGVENFYDPDKGDVVSGNETK